MNVYGYVVVVTGGAAGIGAALAKGLSAAGASVVIFDTNGSGAQQVVKEIKQVGGAALAIKGDVASRTDVENLARAVDREFGRLDVLVNNAAVEGAPRATPLAELADENFDRVMAVNVKGMWLTTQALTTPLGDSGHGSVINMGSIGAFFVTGGYLPYVTSKAAIVGLTKSLARELGPSGIRVNSVAPGSVATESVSAAVQPEIVEQMIGNQAISRRQQPEDLVDPVRFLASAASRFITGQTLVVDGGFVMLP